MFSDIEDTINVHLDRKNVQYYSYKWKISSSLPINIVNKIKSLSINTIDMIISIYQNIIFFSHHYSAG